MFRQKMRADATSELAALPRLSTRRILAGVDSAQAELQRFQFHVQGPKPSRRNPLNSDSTMRLRFDMSRAVGAGVT